MTNKNREYTQVLSRSAKVFGYTRAKNLCWNDHGELTTFVHLQSSQWGAGVYVNVGVTPSEWTVRKGGRKVEYWGISLRADDIDGPFVECFHRMSAEAVDPDSMSAPFEWLVGWIEENLGTIERLDHFMRTSPPWMRRAFVKLAMRQWIDVRVGRTAADRAE